MNISKKIEEIRNQPDHIRIRYVWGCVAVSMFIIIAIWIVSISSLFQGEKNNSTQETSTAPDITEQLQNLKQQAPSLKDFSDTSLTIENEGVKNKKVTTDSQVPEATTVPEIPQTSAYSDLPIAN